MKEHEKKNKILAFEMIIVILISLIAVFATLSFSFNLFTTHTNYSLLNKLITWIDNTDSVTNKNKDQSKKKNQGYTETMTGSIITDKNNNPIYNYKDDESNRILFEYVETSDGIYASNQISMPDEEGIRLESDNYVFHFKFIMNELAKGLMYDIVLTTEEGSTLPEEDLKIFLQSGRKTLSAFTKNGKVKTFKDLAYYDIKTKEKLLYTGIITESEAKLGYKDFTFKMWISEDAFQKNGLSFYTKVNVYGSKI